MPLKLNNRKPDSSRIKLKTIKMATCHPNRPLQARGLCKSCYHTWLMENNPEFAEKQRQNCKNWHDKHKTSKIDRNRKYQSKLDPELKKNRRLMSKFGISLLDYNALLELQKNKCAICGRPSEEFKNGLAVDHDHNTGEIRGLLCFRCNFGMSYFSEKIENFESAVKYLKNGSNINNFILNRVISNDIIKLNSDEKMKLTRINAKTSQLVIPDDIKLDIINRYNSGESILHISNEYSWLCSRKVITNRLIQWGIKN